LRARADEKTKSSYSDYVLFVVLIIVSALFYHYKFGADIIVIRNIKIGSPPLARSPYGMAVSKNNDIYVAVGGFNNVIELSNSGKYTKSLAADWAPSGVVIGRNGNIYVTTGSGYLIKFSKSGKFLKQVFTGITSSGIAIGPDGNIYVAPIHAGHIVKLSRSLKILKVFPAGKSTYTVALNKSGDIYVANFLKKGTITELSPQGKIISVFRREISLKAWQSAKKATFT
jgi:hypothetical protein